jgi:hypothetical protein
MHSFYSAPIIATTVTLEQVTSFNASFLKSFCPLFLIVLADADLMKGIKLMTTANHYLALENEVIEMYLQRMNPELLTGKLHDVKMLSYLQVNLMKLPCCAVDTLRP